MKKPAPKSTKKKQFEAGPKQAVPVRPGNPKINKDGTRSRPILPT